MCMYTVNVYVYIYSICIFAVNALCWSVKKCIVNIATVSMYACVYVSVHVSVKAYVYAHSICICAVNLLYQSARECVANVATGSVYMYADVSVNVSVYVYVYVYVYVSVYAYVDRWDIICVSRSGSIRVPLDFLVLVIPSRPECHLFKMTF